jgi:hypothetical protein
VKEESEIEGFNGEQKPDLISFHICCNTQSTPMLHITQGTSEFQQCTTKSLHKDNVVLASFAEEDP